MALDLSGTPALITGAGSGIGKATALKLAQVGAQLFLIGRTEAKLLNVQQEIAEQYPNVEVAIAAIDVTDKQALETAVNAAVERFGKLSIVVANGTLNPLDLLSASAPLISLPSIVLTATITPYHPRNSWCHHRSDRAI